MSYVKSRSILLLPIINFISTATTDADSIDSIYTSLINQYAYNSYILHICVFLICNYKFIYMCV